MTTFTATPNHQDGTVALHIAPDSPLELVASALLRTDHNGTRPVRVPAGTFPATVTTEAVLVDYEPALSGAVQYRLTDSTGGADVWTTLDGVVLPRFVLPHVPAVRAVVETVTADEGIRESRATVHEIIGRDDPLVNLGRLRTRSGSLVVVSPDWHRVQELEHLAESGQVIMYRQPEHPGRDMYLVASTLRTVPVADVWETTLAYREVSWPVGDLAAAGSWTFADLAAAGGSFDQVAQDYRTFLDLAAGEEIL